MAQPENEFVISGRAAQIYWGRIGHLVPRFESEYLDPATRAPRPVHELDVAEFIMRAAFGDVFDSSAHHGTLKQRLVARHAINPKMYRISLAPERGGRPTIRFDLPGGRTEYFRPGRVRAFMAVTPLTERGYNRYIVDRSVKFVDLTEGDIATADSPYDERPYVVLNTLLHLNSIGAQIAQVEECGTADAVLDNATATVADYLRHVAEFVPPLRLTSCPIGVESAHGPLPLVLAPVSGLGLGEAVLDKFGFDPDPAFDAGEKRLFVFDASKINNPAVDETKRAAMLGRIDLFNRVTNADRHDEKTD